MFSVTRGEKRLQKHLSAISLLGKWQEGHSGCLRFMEYGGNISDSKKMIMVLVSSHQEWRVKCSPISSSLTQTTQHPDKIGIITSALKMADLRHRVTFPRSHREEEAGRMLRFISQNLLSFLPFPSVDSDLPCPLV